MTPAEEKPAKKGYVLKADLRSFFPSFTKEEALQMVKRFRKNTHKEPSPVQRLRSNHKKKKL